MADNLLATQLRKGMIVKIDNKLFRIFETRASRRPCSVNRLSCTSMRTCSRDSPGSSAVKMNASAVSHRSTAGAQPCGP